MKLIKVFTEEGVETLLQRVASINFDDGKLTAKGRIKDKKENFQITRDTVDASGLIDDIVSSLENSPLASYCHPKKFINVRIASYKDGGFYDWHVDAAYMRGVRTDYSFTVFLVNKESYEGGELVLKTDVGEINIKGNAGEVLVYPTTLLHRVNPVTNGERIVIVGWLESMIKDPFCVDFLFRLRSTFQKIEKQATGVDEMLGDFDRLIADAKRVVSK